MGEKHGATQTATTWKSWSGGGLVLAGKAQQLNSKVTPKRRKSWVSSLNLHKTREFGAWRSVQEKFVLNPGRFFSLHNRRGVLMEGGHNLLSWLCQCDRVLLIMFKVSGGAEPKRAKADEY